MNLVLADSQDHTADALFGGEPYELLPKDTDLYTVLVKAGIFKSKGEAKRNWTRPTAIQDGYQELHDIGKLRKSIYLYKPMPYTQQDEPEPAPCKAYRFTKLQVNGFVDYKAERA